MGKKIKFKFQEIDNTGKVLVYIDYIDRKFFKRDFNEIWKYNNIEFSVKVYNLVEEGYLNISYNDLDRLDSFIFHIGTEENYFIINKSEMKLFEDLENIVYNDNKKSLSQYLIDNQYYYIYLVAKHLKYDVDYYNFDKDDVDRDYFLSGNMFRTEKEAREIAKKLNNGEITIKYIKKERQEFFKNYEF